MTRPNRFKEARTFLNLERKGCASYLKVGEPFLVSLEDGGAVPTRDVLERATVLYGRPRG